MNSRARQRSSGVRPVRFAILANIFGPIFIVVKGKHEVIPVRSAERSVRAGLSLQLPADRQQSGQHAPRLRRWPVAQAA